MSELREAIARELFYADWDREHIIYLVASGNWEECETHIKEIYYKEADTIIYLTVKEIKGMENPYDKKPFYWLEQAQVDAVETFRQAIIKRLEA